ncbi:MAG: hypothetical protein HWE30_17825 [Methylocystaceae bacterium]|nr:hypothetical protein [Methylocystaceae bacterium]
MTDRTDTTAGEQYACVLDETVDAYIKLADNFSNDIGAVLTEPMQTMFLSICGLWIVIQGLRAVMGFISPIDILKEFTFVCIAWFLLNIKGIDLVNQIFTVTLDLIGSGASVVMKSAATHNPGVGEFQPVGKSGMTALVCYTEQAMQTVWGVGVTIGKQATLTNWFAPALYALALILPYLLVVVIYGSKTLVTIFRCVFLSTIAPYLMLAFGFGFFRGEAINGLRTLMASFLVFLAATISVAILVYGVVDVGKDIQKEILAAKEGISIFNSKYLMVLFLGWAGSALLTESIGLANSITNTSLSNTAAGVMTAGVVGTGLSLAQKAAGPAGWAASALGVDPGKAVAKHLGNKAMQSNSVGRKASELIDRYNSFVYPKQGK